MAQKIKVDKATDTTIQPLFTILWASIFFFGILGCVLALFPNYSISYLYVATSFSSIGIISSVWLNQKPALLTKFMKFASLTGLLSLITFRFLEYLFPKLSIFLAILISLSVLTVNLLPILDPAKTRFVKQELFFPKTRIGKTILSLSLVFLPIAGVLGASFSHFTNKLGNAKMTTLAIFLAPLSWLLALIIPFSTRSPMSPWEAKKLKVESNSN